MKITVLSSKSIKPAYGANIPPSTNSEAIPLTVLDTVNYDQHISGTFFFHPPAPLTAALELGFAMALAEYPEWAGRLITMDTTRHQGCRRSILLNDAARFVEAMADVTLDSVMPLEPTPEMLSLHPSPAGGEGDELMLVQVTRFACNSLVLGFTWHHHVGDGRAMFNFLVAWGQATRGVAIDPVPVHDRASFFVPRAPPMVEFEHRGAEFMACRAKEKTAASGGDGVVAARVRFSRDMISRLKARAAASAAARVPRSSSRPYSTMACVLGHLWRCITVARGLGGGDAAAAVVTKMHITVDGRARMRRPTVPSGYAGNAVLWARPAAVASELVGRPLAHAAEAISMAVAAVDDGYFRLFIDFASSGAVEEEGLVAAANGTKGSNCPDVEVFSLMGLPSGELDLGSGRTFLYMPSYLPEEGLVFIVPSFNGDGSVHAQVSLFRNAMDVFKDCFYSMDLDAAPAPPRL